MKTSDFIEKKKTASILVRLEKEQREALEKRAKRLGVTVPEFMRALVRECLNRQAV